MKKIIGYKCPQDLYRTHSPKGTVWEKTLHGETYNIKGSDGSLMMPKEVVETWEPVYEEEYKVGNWVYVINGGGGAYGADFCCGKIIDKNEIPYSDHGFDTTACGWAIQLTSGKVWGLSKKAVIRKATPDEIQKVLVKEAEKRGFVKGAQCLTIINNILATVDDKWIYFTDDDRLCSNGVTVYEKGKWAEIVNTKEIIKMRSSSGDFELEVSKEGIYYAPGKVWLDIDTVRILYNLSEYPTVDIMPLNTGNSYSISNFKVKVGCKADIPLKDWKDVWEVYTKIKNGE